MATRNSVIDLLKLGLSFLIIALHIFPVSGLRGWQGVVSYEIVNGITRVGVPSFFIISGYFLRNKLQDRAYLLKYAKRILVLYVVWQLIYLPDLIRFYRLGKFNTFDAVLKLVHGYWHLWYLLATVGAVALLYYFRNRSVRTKFSHAVLLFFVGYGYQLLYATGILNEFSALRLLYEVIGTTRNFIFMAYPFLLLGTLYEDWKINFRKIRLLLFPLLGLLLLESYFYYTLKLRALDFYLTLLPLSMVLFSRAEGTARRIPFEINSTLSLGIYLCHPYAIRLVYEFLPQRTLEFIALKYFLIALLAVAFWFIVARINKRFPYFL